MSPNHLTIFFFIIVSLILSFRLNSAQICSSDKGNVTTNSTYGNNRDLILSFLPHNVSRNGGFYMGTMGQGPNTVYALALCRGDMSPEACFDCVNASVPGLIKKCPIEKEAISWEGTPAPCIVRYSDTSFFGTLQTTPVQAGRNMDVIRSNMTEFDMTWGNFMDTLITKAASGSSKLKFAAGEANTNMAMSQKIYAYLQCTPDLNMSDCSLCLQEALGYFQSCCHGKVGGYVHFPSCILRWDLYPFLNSSYRTSNESTTSPSFNSTPSTTPIIPEKSGARISRTLMLVVFPATSLMAISAISWGIVRLWKQKTAYKADYSIAETFRLDFTMVKTATNDFSDANKLGQGGFGSVYKGELSNGEYIAVKRLEGCSQQGVQEFTNEIALISKLQHKNLVRLIGFCHEGQERLLVYEYIINASLDRILFDPIKCTQLNWVRRYKIIYGIARGILYLHEDSRLKIIHRDLKPGNILLDAELNPKISDFGTARLFDEDQSRFRTKKIAGTYGYMAPEYARHGRFSTKTDVFSFGVVALELVSGMKNTSFNSSGHLEHLLSIVWKNWREGTPLNIMDQRIAGGSRSEILRCIHIGLLCVQDNADSRPNMDSVVLMLNSHSTLQTPSPPGFYMDLNVEPEMPLPESQQMDINCSINEASMSMPYPR